MKFILWTVLAQSQTNESWLISINLTIDLGPKKKVWMLLDSIGYIQLYIKLKEFRPSDFEYVMRSCIKLSIIHIPEAFNHTSNTKP